MTNLNTRRNKYDWDMISSWHYDEGLSYNAIRKRHLDLYGYAPSKGTLSPRFGDGVGEKRKAYNKEYKASPMGKLCRKLDRFKSKNKKNFNPIKEEYVTSSWNRFRDKLKKFRNKGIENMQTWTTEDAKNKFWPNGLSKCGHEFPFIECYLTGEVIDVSLSTTHCDHIDPNGGNGLENLAFVTRDANQMKSYLHMDDWCLKAKVMIEKHEARSSSG